MKWLFAVQLFSTLFMTGLIWCIQVVHYPLFEQVGREQFVNYMHDHQRRITWIVLPVMLVELVSGIALIGTSAGSERPLTVVGGAILLAVIWLSTFVVQVPRHTLLLGGFNSAVIRQLVWTNWLRTACWSTRAGLLLWFLLSEPRISQAKPVGEAIMP